MATITVKIPDPTEQTLRRQAEAAGKPVVHFVEHPPSVYQHPVDPKDSHYVDLAVACNAKLIVSRDTHQLNLMNPLKLGASEFQARFPTLAVLQPER